MLAFHVAKPARDLFETYLKLVSFSRVIQGNFEQNMLYLLISFSETDSGKGELAPFMFL